MGVLKQAPFGSGLHLKKKKDIQTLKLFTRVQSYETVPFAIFFFK